MRHSSSRTTLDIYARAVSQQQRQANRKSWTKCFRKNAQGFSTLRTLGHTNAISAMPENSLDIGVVWWT